MADGDGYGQQGPATSSSAFNTIQFIVEQAIAKLHTIKIVKVQAVDTDAKTVQVLPLVQQIDGNDQVTSQGTIYGVPYGPWLFGSNAVEADPAVGDIGVMACADRDISAVKETHAEAPPGSLRRYNQADGIYLGGLYPNGDITQYIKFTDTGMQWHDKNGNDITSDAAGISINGVVFNRQGEVAGNLPVTGNLQLGGTLQALNGTGYTADISTSGKFFGTDFQIGSGGTKITLLGHFHAANNTPPTPGH